MLLVSTTNHADARGLGRVGAGKQRVRMRLHRDAGHDRRAMPDPLMLLEPGRVIAVQLATGEVRRGLIMGVGGGWLHLVGDEGVQLINLGQAALISLDAQAAVAAAPVDAPRPRPMTKDVPIKTGSRAPGRPWQETELKELSEAYLDGRPDAELAERFHRTRGQIKELRQGFECARGNLVDDQISQVARTWVGRWRKVLGGAR